MCHKLALVFSIGLQALGIQAPPPPLVKSTMLGNFAIPTTTLQSVPDEEDGDGDAEEEDAQEVNDSDLQPAQESTGWYDVIDGPHKAPNPPIEPLPSNCNAANAVDSLMTKVSLIPLTSLVSIYRWIDYRQLSLLTLNCVSLMS